MYMVRSPIASPLTSVAFHHVIVFPCYSLYFNTPWAKYTEVKYQHNQFFYMNINFEELLSEIENVLLKGGFKLTMFT